MDSMKNYFVDPSDNKSLVFLNGKFFKEGREIGIPLIKDIPRFVTSDTYSSNWSYQWRRWANLHYTDKIRTKTRKDFMKDFNFNPFDSNVEPMRILDAGCGNGCKMELFKNTQHFVWGVDLSNSVDYAQENLRNYDNLQLVQADINNLPFADGFFDFIYSSGVLIHVPDVEQSLVSLMRKLKRGGTIGLAMAKAISPFALKHVIKESIVSFFRIFTTRLENEDKIMSIVNYLSNLYRYDSRIIRLFVPVLNEDEEWRKCYIHDFLTAKYRKRQKPGKIIKILRKHGFGDIKIFSTNQVSMTAVKK